MTLTRKNVEFAKRVFADRLGDPYVYGGYYDAFHLDVGADCSGSAGIFIGAALLGADRMSWTRQFTTEDFPGGFAGFRQVSQADLLAGDYPIKVCIHHGGGGPNSHMQIILDGVVMESNGGHGTCTTGRGAMDPADNYWNDFWVLDGGIAEDGTPRTEIPMTLYGPDTSNNNFGSTAAAIDFVSRLPGEGFSFIEQKVSEGNYYRDPYWPAIRDWCAANHFPCIGYHYVTTNDADAQAALWLANGGGPFATLDFEANSGDIANFWRVVNAFNRAGVEIALSYIPHWYWQQIGSPDLTGVPGLISSNYVGEDNYASALYPGAHGAGWQPYGGATPQIWQFTDGALIAGLSVDCNAFEGTLDQLIALLKGTTVTQPDPVMAALSQLQATVSDIQTQLRGPAEKGWPQLGKNAAGEDLTLVDAVAAIKNKVGA